MKNKKLLSIIASALAVCAAFGVTVAAAYDSSEDPLITWSYLRDIFKPEILDYIDDHFEEYDVLLNEMKTEETEEPEVSEEETVPEETVPEEDFTQSEESVQQTASFMYEVVELTDGDALYAISACDIMLRAGSAFCIAPDEKQGIADYTSGEEIYNSMPLTKNHMCLIPRGDGRGILAASESVFIMVRGDYTIVRK